MAVTNNMLTWHIAAGEDLDDGAKGTGDIFKAIALDDGKPAANGAEAGGLLCQLGKTGQGVALGIQGVMKGIAGGAIAAGKAVTVAASGYLVTATSGTYVVGRNADTAATSGSVFTGIFDFSKPIFAVDSNVA